LKKDTPDGEDEEYEAGEDVLPKMKQ